jgi:deferrochelatase/peroxidase EfeB
MRRRDFNRFALGIGLSPILANAQLFGRTEALAQEPRPRQDGVLELDDLQHIVITRVPALTGRYEFLTFRQAAQGRAWLAGILDHVASVQQARDSIEREQRWISVAFTYQGLRALGVDEQALATFPEEFRQGMVARAEMLGDIGRNHPDRWVGGLASPALHAIAILFSRNATERQRATREHQTFLASTSGVEVLSSLDVDGFPPFDYAHDHFGYRDRLSEPQIEGSGVEPTPGSGAPVKAGEFILGYVDESGTLVPLPQPQILSRNGTFMAYRRLWRSGAPLILVPEKDDPALGADYQRNNDFNYAQMDPKGYAVPLGSHIRRMNPRDTAANIQRRRMVRRGATYGPPLPEGAPEDGVDRGIASFILCGSLVRQFEFAQNVWINDPNFHELGNERDPLIGNQDGSFDFTMPKRPIRKKITGMPAFTTLLGGAYFFLPGIKALRYLAALT